MHSSKLVLTVNGSRLVRTMVSRHLRRYGCSVVEASDARQAREIVRQHRPDLILVDAAMLPSLRHDEPCASIPMILLVPRDQASARDASDARAGCLPLPFQEQIFDREVSTILGAPHGSAR